MICPLYKYNFFTMKRFYFFALVVALSSLLVLGGCLGPSEGVPLFSDTEEEEVTDEITEEENLVEEFGFIVEGTFCTKQLHGGCVPADYKTFESGVFGLPFVYPSDWLPVSVDENSVKLAPTGEEGDPTTLFAWRGVAIDDAYDVVKTNLIDADAAMIGPYDVTWEIYEGEWNEMPVTAEWVTLVYDEDNPWVNYTFFLITERDSFLVDQASVKAAASSVWPEEEDEMEDEE